MPIPLSFESRVYGGWLGKSVGGTLGLPAEGRAERLHYTFYDPVPTEAPPNDDLELQLVWLHVLENKGFALTQQDMADAWLAHIHYMWDEYGRCRWNLRRSVPASEAGTWENFFESGMGSPIRSEIWACVCNGNADLAARYASLDASLDHGQEGIAGEVFFAVLQTLVLAETDLAAALPQAAQAIDPDTETARAIQLVFDDYARQTEAWACREHLLGAHDSENFTHAPLNVALTAWALLYGEGDFGKSILLGVNGGYDTDCTGATVGATLGLMLGREGIPSLWRDPIGEKVLVGPGILGINAAETLSELTDRTCRLAERLAQQSPPIIEFPAPTGKVNLSDLPGTILLRPLNGDIAVQWANGELPPEVKRAGGAAWDWQAAVGQTYHLMALAKGGARLFVDDRLVVNYPPDLPYVPAPHRCPGGSQVLFVPTQAAHHMRLELDSTDENQPVSVILSRANFHLVPWPGAALPFEPILE